LGVTFLRRIRSGAAANARIANHDAVVAWIGIAVFAGGVE
jgi:hypothetical protein